MSTDHVFSQFDETTDGSEAKSGTSAAGTARKPGMLSPLFPGPSNDGEYLPADQIGQIVVQRVFSSVRGGPRRIKVSKKEFVDPQTGEVFEIDPHTTTEDDLEEILGGGEYWIFALDLDGKITKWGRTLLLPGPMKPAVRQMYAQDARATARDRPGRPSPFAPGAFGEDDEDFGGTPSSPQGRHAGGAVTAEDIARIVEDRMARLMPPPEERSKLSEAVESAREIQAAAAAATRNAEKAIEELRRQLADEREEAHKKLQDERAENSARRRDHEEQMRAARAQYDRELDDLRRRNRDETDSLRKRYESEIDDLRRRTERDVAELRKELLDTRTRLEKQAAELLRENVELQRELASIPEPPEEGDANGEPPPPGGGGGMPGGGGGGLPPDAPWLAHAVAPALPGLIGALMGAGRAAPAAQQASAVPQMTAPSHSEAAPAGGPSAAAAVSASPAPIRTRLVVSSANLASVPPPPASPAAGGGQGPSEDGGEDEGEDEEAGWTAP